MRYGIFSDTHANLGALEAVLREFDRESVDALVCIGDTVGYGPQPDECCDKVRKLTRHTILGNHDAAVSGRMDYSYYYDAAREALDLLAPANVIDGAPGAVDDGVDDVRDRDLGLHGGLGVVQGGLGELEQRARASPIQVTVDQEDVDGLLLERLLGFGGGVGDHDAEPIGI